MTFKLTSEKIAAASDYDGFVTLMLELGCEDGTEFFEFLFTEAISGSPNGTVAARLLVELEPKPTCGCEELLEAVAKSKWDVSVTEVPFYLIVQFGKPVLLESYDAYIRKAELSGDQKQRIGALIYWIAPPAADLIRAHHNWPWTEARDLT